MDRAHAMSIALVTLAAAALVALPVHPREALAAEPSAFPKRKPGLWEIRSTAAHASGLAPTHYCVGESTDVQGNHLDRVNGQRGACALGPFKRAGTAWLAESVCKEGKTTVSSRAVASGDLGREYRIDTVVTYDPPLAGVRREDREAVVARYLGACPAGQRPGDMTIPGVGVMNMADGTFRAEREPPAQKRTRPAGAASH